MGLQHVLSWRDLLALDPGLRLKYRDGELDQRRVLVLPGEPEEFHRDAWRLARGLAMGNGIKAILEFLKERPGDERLSAFLSEVAKVLKENAELRHEVEDLRGRTNYRDSVAFRGRAYYAAKEIQGYGDGPFCPACLDGKGLLSAMIPAPFKNVHVCPSCKFEAQV